MEIKKKKASPQVLLDGQNPAASSSGAQGFASFSATELAAAVPYPSLNRVVGERVSLGAESIRGEYFVLKMHRSAQIYARGQSQSEPIVRSQHLAEEQGRLAVWAGPSS